MNLFDFKERSRVMVLAPHPDDETLATGGLLQAATAAGAKVRVVFLTRGEDNAWPQRVMERRWRIKPADRERWGRLRVAEALAALQELGVGPDDVVFLDLPDQRLTELLLSKSAVTAAQIARVISDWKPTFIAGPSTRDLHPDHSAAAVLVRLALEHLPKERPQFDCVEFVVHARGSKKRPADALALELTEAQQSAKRRAIRRHASQLKFGAGRLLAHARPHEDFIAAGQGAATGAHHPVREARINNGHIELDLSMRPSTGAFGRSTVYLVAGTAGRVGVRLLMPLPLAPRTMAPRARRVEVRDVETGVVIATGEYVGGRRGGRLILPHRALAGAERIFIKLERRWGFFDEAGWRELPISLPK